MPDIFDDIESSQDIFDEVEPLDIQPIGLEYPILPPQATLAEALRQPTPMIEPWQGGVVRSALPGSLQPEDLLPAVRKIGGELSVGEQGDTHPDIIESEGIPAVEIDQRGFVGPQGFMDRESAATALQAPTQFEPGRLHSTDLSTLQEPEGYQKQLEKVAEEEGPQPLVTLPEIPESLKQAYSAPVRAIFGDKAADVEVAAADALYKAAKSVPEFLTTEEGMLSVLASLVPVGRLGVEAYFARDMANKVVEGAKSMGEAWDKMTAPQKAAQITQIASEVGLTAMLAKAGAGTARKFMATPEPPIIPRAETPPPDAMPPAVEPTPAPVAPKTEPSPPAKPRTLTPAVIADDGTGTPVADVSHSEARIRLVREQQKFQSQPQNERFIDENGNVLTREEAATRFKEITGKDPRNPGTLDSSEAQAAGIVDPRVVAEYDARRSGKPPPAPAPAPAPERAASTIGGPSEALPTEPKPAPAASIGKGLEPVAVPSGDMVGMGAALRGEVGRGTVMEGVIDWMRKVGDYFGLKPIPKLERAGVGDAAYAHASARNAVPHTIKDFLSKIFPDQYHDPVAMSRTIDIINKDNILGGYDDAVRARDAAETPQAKAVAEERVKAIEESHDLDALNREVEAARQDPTISANIERWKNILNPEMDRLYNEMRGADPNTPRETRGRIFGARVNLLPTFKAEEMATWTDASRPLPTTSVSNYRNPNVRRDPFARRARLTGQYSTDPQLVLTNSLGHRYNEVTKLRFYDALERGGVAGITDAGEGRPGWLPDTAKRLSIKMPETSPEGRTRMVEKSLWVKPELVREIRDVLNTDQALPANPVGRVLTTIQLAQLADATSHMKNIHTVIVNSLGSSKAWRDAVRKLPFLGTADAVTRISSVAKEIAADTREIRAEIAQMAKQGLIRPKYPATGIQKITRGQQVIHDVDTASRVVMNRFFNNLVERGWVRDTVSGRRKFVQQIGEYNRRLMGPTMAWMRDMGVSPFVVAGRTFNRFAKRQLVGSYGFEAKSRDVAAKARATQFAGLVTAFTLPAIINYAITGKFGGRPGTPIGAVDTGMDTKEGKHRIIDVLHLLGVRRGLRATGIGALVEGVRAGETVNRITGKAFEDITSTMAHPWMGPAPAAIYSGVTGKRLDLRGGASPYLARNVGGGAAQIGENLRVTLKNQNPLLYGVLSPLLGEPEETWAESSAKGFLKSPLASIGYTEPAGTTASSQVYEAVRRFLERSKDPKLQEQARKLAGEERGQKEESAYAALRHHLRNDDTAAAVKEYDKLLKTHKPKDIAAAINPYTGGNYSISTGTVSPRKVRPFTGSLATEAKFLRSLTPEERELYKKALAERSALYKKFQDMVRSRRQQRDEFGGIILE